MPYETMILDQYAIQDSAKRVELLSRLREIGDVPHDEIPDSDLSSFLWAAARLFDPSLQSWEDIQTLHEHGIILWSAMSIADHGMMSSAKYFPIKSRVGETDPSKRVAGYVAIKRELRKQFEEYLEDAGISLGDTEIVQGELIRRSLATDMMEPTDTQKIPAPVTLTLLRKTSTSIDLAWGKSGITDFCAYIIYMDTQPNLQDRTRIGEDNMPGVREDVTEVLVIDKQWQDAARIPDLTPGTFFWFVLAVQDINGRVAFSNELRVGTNT